ncbi:diguanylate cyclase (GGDEF) domain-containing protein [Dethiosulfatibacter aminovorans DSM 17477]|uniref:Diguanylate cyclase (GGDEF) domain-containing protein n=1 Tax=Dethiosulfatibacter aminovorans DSM 17477 TaxID=1121476 RepID=A0A1M6HTJ4_9FIRM|nr:GGDEF domain-containing protein [Dethiosulfatibacter aminovorans]SHJ25526.1 diguanylate cyclase (GGDEF) domain-containing protein [Dethiosulfatibacter aminovorans DSM 17477]
MNKTEKYAINKLTCNFKDKKIENEYFDSMMKKDTRYFKPLILLVAIVYILFMIPEYLFLSNESNYLNLIAIRTLTLVIILCLYHMVKRSKDSNTISMLVSIIEIILVGSYFVLVSQYDTVEFFLKVMDMIILITVVFMLPNKFNNKVVVSLILYAGFFFMAWERFQYVENQHFAAGMVYSFLMIFIITITYYKVNYYNRVNYTHELELKILSETDHLTGIYNRIKFDDELDRWIRHKARYKGSLSLIMMDFDEFKLINDRYGHLAGDRVLKDGVDVIKKIVRNTDVFARWGGEEFILLLPETSCDKAVALAERIRKALEEYEFHTGDRVTCSFGVVEIVEGETMQNAVNRVDELLYKAKGNGRNRVERQEKQ